MPTAEQIAIIICETADVMNRSDDVFENRYACTPEVAANCEACMSKAREIVRLFSVEQKAETRHSDLCGRGGYCPLCGSPP